MGTLTPVLSLYKPDGTELVDEAAHLNANWDKVDAAFSALGTQIVSKQSDQFTTSTTLADVTDLTLPVLANATYFVQCFVRARGFDATPGADTVPQFAFLGPTLDYLAVAGNGSAVVDMAAYGTLVSAFTRNNGTNAMDDQSLFKAEGMVRFTASGNFKLQFKNNGVDVTKSVGPLKGSTLRLVRTL